MKSKKLVQKKIQKTIALGLIFASGCSQTTANKAQSTGGDANRTVASEPAQDAALVYFTYDKNNRPVPDVISSARWNEQLNHNGKNARLDYLTKIYYANTRETSLRGIRHDACFEGHAVDIQKEFFNSGNSNNFIPSIASNVPNTYPSEDGMMLGISFDLTSPSPKHIYFRLHNCNAGKSPVGQDSSVSFTQHAPHHGFFESILAKFDSKWTNRSPASADQLQQGFVINDAYTVKPVPANLPTFSLRADFDQAFGDDDLPWRQTSLNLQNKKDAFALAVLLQKYFYENMANQNPNNPDQNFIATQNTSRYWCNMPWQNQGPSGREIVHGLTKERNLVASPQMTAFKSPPDGTDWGVGYYNAVACRGIQNVFGTKANPKTPDFTQSVYSDGSVAAKILFTTGDFPAIHNAYTWTGNVTTTGVTTRTLQSVRHIQMDISIKDSKIAGSNGKISGWTMFTYYYDENYDYAKEYQANVGGASPLASVSKIPVSLLKMRPMGVQFGMDANETLIFANAQTNGFQGRLNGPADNPKSSCLSCHSTAGTQAGMVPGFMKDADYSSQKNGSLDFSQQFALAKRNYETVEQTAK